MVKYAFLLIGLIAAGATPSQAETKTGIVKVTASIPRNCDIRTSDQAALDFGQQSNLTTQIDGVGVIRFICSYGVTSTVYANQGVNYAPPNRRMKHATLSSYIQYGIFLDAARGTAFPIAAGTISVTGNGEMKEVPIYGRIPSQAGPSAGNYADTLLVTVSW